MPPTPMQINRHGTRRSSLNAPGSTIYCHGCLRATPRTPVFFNLYTPYPLDSPFPVVPTFSVAMAPSAAAPTGPATRSTPASAAPTSAALTAQPASTRL
eukprot:5313419-Pleurochrysis_carterae.AAC.2